MTTEEAIATVTIDLTAQEFLAELARAVPWDERLVGCWFEGDPNEGNQHKWRPRPITSTTRIPLDANTYVTVSAFRRAVTPEGDDAGFRRKTEFFARGVALMVDDIGTKAPADIPRRVPPTALIETSPGNFQAWYFLSPAEADKERFDYAIRAFISARLLGQDPGMAGVNRVGRLPAGINGKAKYAAKNGGRAWRCRTHIWAPSRRWSLDAVMHAFGIDLDAFISSTRPQRAVPLANEVAQARIADFRRIVEWCSAAGMIKSKRVNMGGWMDVRCPWIEQHSDRADSGAAIGLPNAENGYHGAFECHHKNGHDDLRWRHFAEWVGDRIDSDIEATLARTNQHDHEYRDILRDSAAAGVGQRA